MASTPDPALLLAALPREERAVVLRWLDALGMEPEELDCVPPLRSVVEMVAALALLDSGADGTTREEAFDAAAGALGLSGPTLARRWYRWHERAARHFVRRDDGAS